MPATGQHDVVTCVQNVACKHGLTVRVEAAPGLTQEERSGGDGRPPILYDQPLSRGYPAYLEAPDDCPKRKP